MNLWKNIVDLAVKKLDQVLDIEGWAREEFGIELFPYQVEVVKACVDRTKPYVAIVGCRNSGKSFSVALGLVKLCLDEPDVQIGLFGPKIDQATRLINEIRSKILRKRFPDFVDVNKSTQSRLVFNNGSTILAMSAFESSLIEGFHFDGVVIDEAQRVSDLSMERTILPMVGSGKFVKVIKLGVPLFRGHFYNSFKSDVYYKISWDWTQAELLLRSGYVVVDGKKYSKFVLERMPLSLKKKFFPNNPELWFDGDMSERDFRTQYMCEWLDDITSFLTKEDHALLIGEHQPLLSGLINEKYYFGLDTSVGISSKSSEYNAYTDFTALSIFRKREDGVKEKVYAQEWKSSFFDQIGEIISLVHPKYGRFKCQFGLVDFSSTGSVAVEALNKEGVPAKGILFGAVESTSGKNFKNAMFDHFLLELRAGRVKYPSSVYLNHNSVLSSTFLKHFNQWGALQRMRGSGVNDKIIVDDEIHDDGPCADVLAVYACDKSEQLEIRPVNLRLGVVGKVPSAILPPSKPKMFGGWNV